MKNNKQTKNSFKEIVTGDNGFLSSKRVMGVVVLSICVICTCWLVYAEGGTQVVENLLQTLMIMSAALLGISSITSIWKGGKSGETAKTITEVAETEKPDPCKDCIHNKKETE